MTLKELTATAKRTRLFVPLLIVLFALLPVVFAGNEYLIMVLCFIELYTIAVSGLDILFGHCGQISMGHAAYYAIGAYGSALLHNYLHIPVFFSMILAAAIAAGIGALLAWPASKLKFHFLSLATIAFGEVVYQLLIHSPGKITGNFNGLFTDRIELFGLKFDTYQKCFYFGMVVTLLFLLAKYMLVHSRTGRAFAAVRDNSLAAEGMGINSRKYKIIAFATSAFFVAYAGAFYMHMICYVHPDTFMQKQSVLFLTMLVLGGTASISGPIVGAAIIELLMENIRFLQDYQMLVYGCVLLIVIILIPGGIVNEVKNLMHQLRSRKIKEVKNRAHDE